MRPGPELDNFEGLCFCVESHINNSWDWWNTLDRWNIISFCRISFNRLKAYYLTDNWCLIILAFTLSVLVLCKLNGRDLHDLREDRWQFEMEDFYYFLLIKVVILMRCETEFLLYKFCQQIKALLVGLGKPTTSRSNSKFYVSIPFG